MSSVAVINMGFIIIDIIGIIVTIGIKLLWLLLWLEKFW